MKHSIILITILFLFLSCNSENETTKTQQREETSDTVIHKIVETKTAIRIANDSATVIIKHLSKNNFEISLYQTDTTLLAQIDNDFVSTIDSLASLNNEAILLENIRYKSIRANTLYFDFKAIHERSNTQIHGDFNLFYRTAKKGTIYGTMISKIL